MRSGQQTVVGAFALIGVLYLGFCVPLLPVASDDFRMVNVFSIDESDIVTHVWNLYVTGGKTRPSFKYGGVFYYVPAVFLYAWSIIGPVTEQMTIVAVRLFCILSGVGCLWLTYLLGREVFDAWTGVIATFLLMVGATFLRWSVESHPDLPQLFFLLGSLFFACRCARDFRPLWWFLAAVCAGLAFGTKYGGIFLLPVLGLAIFMPEKQGDLVSGLRIRRRWLGVLALPVVFALVFGITNPMAVIHVTDFWNALALEKEIMGFGHRVAADSAPWTWLTSLFSMVGWGHSAVLLGGGCWFVFLRRWQLIRADRVVLLIWIVLFLGYLMAESHLKRPRHLLPVLPCVLLFIGAAYGAIWAELKSYVGRWAWAGLLVVVVVSGGHLRASAALFADRYGRENGRIEIVAGRWLAESFPKETSMLFDVYAYVPTQFQNVFRTIGMSYPLVNHFEPDLLVVRDAVVSDYADPEEAMKSRQGPLWYLDRHYFYTYLQQGLVPTYQLVRDFGSVAVYERTISRVREEGDVRQRWLFLLEENRKNHRYGLVEAHWTMAYLHKKQGRALEAKVDHQRAQKSSNFAKRIYSHGTHMLNAGHVEMARLALAEALEVSKGESLMYRAGMREDLAFRFFRVGLYRDMLNAAEEALALTDNLPVATFERAVAHLLLGEKDLGYTHFGVAVERFGAHEKGKRLLDAMAKMDAHTQVARRLMKQYYGVSE